jgi:hypothetical protein
MKGSAAELTTEGARREWANSHEFPVPPLALPDLTHLAESEDPSPYAVVALFLLCAKAARPDFQMTPTNIRAIAEICVRLVATGRTDLQIAKKLMLSPAPSIRMSVLSTASQVLPHVVWQRAMLLSTASPDLLLRIQYHASPLATG